MRALLLAVLAFAAPARAQNQPLYPQGWKPVVVRAFGGLNLLEDSAALAGDAQVATNVLTDNSYLEKRPGNVRLVTILAGYPVQYVNNWAAPNGSLYLVTQASQTIYQTNFSGAPVALSTVAAGFNLTTAPAFSKLEFADGFRPLWTWNDTSTATVTDSASGQVAPVCTYVAFKDSRIWCANLPNGFSVPGNTQNGGGSSTVLISSTGGDGYWSVPANVGLVDNVANRFDFNPDDGDQITCLAATPWGMFVGKRYSSYIVKGSGNLTYDPRLLDPKIGCVDNRSVQYVYPGVLLWLSVNGVYGYDGSGPPVLLSRELDPLMQTVRESVFSQGQWATQLAADWATGTTSTTTGNVPLRAWDYTSVPGSVFPSSGTLYDDNTSPALQTCTSQINPASSLPWTCGVGFSSDTLINIDTVTYPLSVGVAQVIPSSSGVQVWSSSFSDGTYNVNATTWTTLSGVFDKPSNSGYAGDGINAQCGSAACTSSIYTAANSVHAPPDANGWMYGSWSWRWMPVEVNIANHGGLVVTPTYGWGNLVNGGGCFEFDFLSDAKSTTFNGYGVKTVMNSCTSTSCTYTASLLRSKVVGGKTTLASGSFSIPKTASYIGFSSFTVTRTVSGDFNVWYGTSNLVSYHDTDAAITKNLYSLLTLYYSFSGGTDSDNGYNTVDLVRLNGNGSGSIVSRVIDTGQGTALAGVLSSSYTLQGKAGETELDFYVRSSTSPNNDVWTSWQASSNSVLATLPGRYWQYEALFTSRIASATAQLQSVSLPAVTTGYYYSQVDFVGSLITAWRQFGVTQNTPGVYGYAVRQATYNFSPSDTSIAWVTQTANQNVNLSVSTPTYAQYRLDSTPLVSNPLGASAAEPITAVFLRWDQGANLPVASATLERRYLLCVTVSTSATAPDTCLLRQKNGKWVTWSNGGTIGAMGLYNAQMVAADGGTSSKVWAIMQPNVYQDDGSPIAAEWVGADDTDGLPFNDKQYYGALLDLLPVSGSSVTFAYAVNKSTGYVATTLSTDNGAGLNRSLPVTGSQYGSLTPWLPPAAGYDTGKFIRIRFYDATLDAYYRVNGYQYFVHDNPWSAP